MADVGGHGKDSRIQDGAGDASSGTIVPELIDAG